VIAKQGHTYMLGNQKVMAMESGKTPMVHAIDHNSPWPLRRLYRVNAESLTPCAMVCFGGVVP